MHSWSKLTKYVSLKNNVLKIEFHQMYSVRMRVYFTPKRLGTGQGWALMNSLRQTGSILHHPAICVLTQEGPTAHLNMESLGFMI